METVTCQVFGHGSLYRYKVTTSSLEQPLYKPSSKRASILQTTIYTLYLQRTPAARSRTGPSIPTSRIKTSKQIYLWFITPSTSHLRAVDLLEVGQRLLGLGSHGSITLLPVGRADLAKLVGELEGVNETEGLVDGTANGEVVDGDLGELVMNHISDWNADLAELLGGVNDEETTEGNTILLDKDAIVLSNLVGLVAQQGPVDGTETTVPPWGIGPREESVLGVDGAEENLGTTLAELLDSVGEGNNLISFSMGLGKDPN